MFASYLLRARVALLMGTVLTNFTPNTGSNCPAGIDQPNLRGRPIPAAAAALEAPGADPADLADDRRVRGGPPAVGPPR
jgi:hypothetical protein